MATARKHALTALAAVILSITTPLVLFLHPVDGANIGAGFLWLVALGCTVAAVLQLAEKERLPSFRLALGALAVALVCYASGLLGAPPTWPVIVGFASQMAASIVVLVDGASTARRRGERIS